MLLSKLFLPKHLPLPLTSTCKNANTKNANSYVRTVSLVICNNNNMEHLGTWNTRTITLHRSKWK